jgi:hypothetical protein
MSACYKFIDDLLVSAMDTVKDTNCQPRTGQCNFFK